MSRPLAQRYAGPATAAPSQPLIGAEIEHGVAMQARTWERVQIEPGLELHVRDDYELPIDTKAENRIVAGILELLRSSRSKDRKRGKQP